jgi:hypothetical protein
VSDLLSDYRASRSVALPNSSDTSSLKTCPSRSSVARRADLLRGRPPAIAPDNLAEGHPGHSNSTRSRCRLDQRTLVHPGPASRAYLWKAQLRLNPHAEIGATARSRTGSGAGSVWGSAVAELCRTGIKAAPLRGTAGAPATGLCVEGARPARARRRCARRPLI